MAPPEGTHQSPVQPWHFQTHPGSRAGTRQARCRGFLLQGKHLPCAAAARQDVAAAVAGIPVPLAVLPARCGAAGAAGSGDSPVPALSLPRRLLSRWCCPHCLSRLPTSPARTWLLLLLLEASLEEEGEDLVRSSLPRAIPSVGNTSLAGCSQLERSRVEPHPWMDPEVREDKSGG